MRLRTKILMMVCGGVAVFTIAMFLVLSSLAKDQMDRTVRENMQTANTVLGKFIQEHGHRLQNAASLVAGLVQIRDYVQQQDKAILKDVAADYCRKLGADAVLVLGRDGEVLAQERVTPGLSMPRPTGVAARAALEGRSTFRLIVDQGRLRITAGVPVTIAGVPWGAICFSEDVDSSVAKRIANEVGALVAFEVAGTLIGVSEPDVASASLPTGRPSEFKIGNVAYMALKSPLPKELSNEKVCIVTMQRKDELLGAFRSYQSTLLATFAIALGVAMLLAVVFASNISSPIEHVVRAAETVRQGSWPEPFHSKRSDEIGVLQSAFDKMTDSVRAAQDRLMSMLDMDVLTELANHRSFQERLGQEAARAVFAGEELSLILIDLDHFQEFNKVRGHAVGDRVLRIVADTLRSRLSEIAFAGRYGGEEFAVVLPRTSCEEAETVAEMLRKEIPGAINRELGSRITASFGCSTYGAEESSSSALTLEAELALAQAKQLGRDRVCRFDSSAGTADVENQVELQSFLADGSYATIQALAAAVDAKDPYTQGHSMRVADYASSLAKAIGMSDSEVELVRITGTLHDVGKIGVPDAILLKPDALSEDERKVIETHPVLGEVIVRKVPALEATLPGVRGHHERWDGNGYPDRLAGESIPRIARILALADTFDAITSDRPYREGMSANAALSVISSCSGSQFDPELVPTFLSLMEERFGKKAA